MSSERLERKKVNGQYYYYYSRWEWREGKCRRVWQKYLGKLEDIARSGAGGVQPAYAEVFQFGLPMALWEECRRQGVVAEIDRLCPKRRQGLSVGEYLALASVNRAIRPVSKKGMWDWFAGTSLHRSLPAVEEGMLSSQRFWDHMQAIGPERAVEVWTSVVASVVRREAIDLSRVSYDGTNFYTFINTFNTRSALALRGKNKQGRGNLRQVSYAVFCSREGIPLFYDVYEGNRADVREFPVMVERFERFLGELGPAPQRPIVTVIFDKGNNSKPNIELLDRLGLDFIGSVKLKEHPELTQVSNRDKRWQDCTKAGLAGVKSFSVEKVVYGRARRLVTVFNPELCAEQRRTLENDLTKALERLEEIRQRLGRRQRGETKGGIAPTVESVGRECAQILDRPFLKEIVRVEVQPGPILQYAWSPEGLEQTVDTWLGKKILITNPKSWSDEEIVEAYHGQFVVEHLFREMKNRERANWWPLHHWTDAQIRVHALYCTVAMLLRSLLIRRVRQAGINLSVGQLYRELNALREVVNFYPKLGKRKQQTTTVLTRTSELQQHLMETLGLRLTQV